MKKLKYDKGDKVGKDLIFIENVVSNVGNTKALFRCVCGNEFITVISKAKNNTTKSCGCLKGKTLAIEYKKGDKIKGEITYVKLVSRNPRFSLFKCYCGNIWRAKNSAIVHGHIKSCGCLKNTNIAAVKHGDSYNYLYLTYQGILRRCYKKNRPNYKYYGGKGVTVFEPWRNSYIEFKKWILTNIGEKPSNKYSIDRIDPYGNYEPGNLRWADRKTQANNKRKKEVINELL